jgi:hypothetical protein
MDNLSGLVAPLQTALGPYLPRMLGALAIVAAAWLGARLLRALVQRAWTRAGLEERLASPGLGATLASLAGALVWLLALPALLGMLELQGLLAPVNAMMSRLLAFVPNLFGAVVVLGVGILLARIARQVVSGLLRAAGSERAAARVGLGTALGEQGLAGIAGQVVFVLVLLPTLVAALQPLGMDALTQPLVRLLDTLVALVPRLLAAAILVGVAVLLGRALATLASTLLAGAGLDRLPERLGARALRIAGRQLSELAGSVVFAAVVVVALMQATDVLGLPVLTSVVGTLGGALAQLAVALVVAVAGVLLAAVAARAVESAAPRNGRLLGLAARGAILFFAGALALRQAGLPAEIVAIAFGAVVGSVAVAVAVALGIGGRGVAERALERLAAQFEAAPQASGTAAAPATTVTASADVPDVPAAPVMPAPPPPRDPADAGTPRS